MDELTFKRLIERYQRGLLSEKEKALMDEWFASFDQEADASFSSADQDRLKGKIMAEITQSDKHRPLGETAFRLNAWKVAASLLLLVAFSYALWNISGRMNPDVVATVRIVATDDVKKTVLADGSIVWLKPNSSLTYPEQFNGNRREVTLEGEGLFEVTKDSLHPFIIECGDLFTTVLGTSFNIKSTANNIEVVVLTGKVSLTSKSDTKGVIVLPNEKALYLLERREITKAEKSPKKEEVRAALAGTEYSMEFQDTRMSEVIKRIEGKFNVKVSVTDADILNCMITADFSGQSLERTLDMMAMALACEYEIKGSGVALSGEGCPDR